MKKRIFSLFFAVVFLMTAITCIVPAAAEEEAQWRPSVSVVDGAEMVVVLDGTVLTGSLTTATLPSGKPADGMLWKVSVKNKGAVFQSVATEQYLNITKDGPVLVDKAQTLTLTKGIGGTKISSGSYYLTLSGNAWTATDVAEEASVVQFYTDAIKEYDNAGQEPLFTLACVSDLHIDYGIQNNDPPIRPSTIVAMDAIKKLGGADAMIVGGDVVSGNSKTGWGQALFNKVKETIYSTLAPATDSGNVFLITGNHDNEPGVFGGGFYHSGNYDDIMLDNAGEFTASFYSTELENPVESTRFNELLCYRYNVDGMEIIGLNTPYRSERTAGYIYAEQIDWLTNQMKEIGRDKTVVVFCHYPLDSVISPAGDKGGNANTKLKSLLGLYPNILYCYGHIHDGNDMPWYNTIEKVEPAGAVTQLENGAYESKRYHTCYMGSLGYYDHHYQPGGLTEDDPMVVQFLMMDFYADHITFKYYNCGEKAPDPDVYEMSSFTIMRDMWQLTGGTPSGDSGNADPSDKTDAPATDAPVTSGDTASSGGMSPAVLTVLIVCGAVIVGCAVFAVLFLAKNKKGKK